MQIFVLRHGQAEVQQSTDEARNLTEKGRRDVVISITQSLSEMNEVEEIWSSPLVRALQTAQITHDIFLKNKISAAMKTVDVISPESNPNDFFQLLQSNSAKSVLLASHQPFVGDLLDIFCGSQRGYHPMNTASLALIEYEFASAGSAKLRWLRHING